MGSDGWIDWAGGDQPVSDDTAVAVRFFDGEQDDNAPARFWDWNHIQSSTGPSGGNIIAYRVVSA